MQCDCVSSKRIPFSQISTNCLFHALPTEFTLIYVTSYWPFTTYNFLFFFFVIARVANFSRLSTAKGSHAMEAAEEREWTNEYM